MPAVGEYPKEQSPICEKYDMMNRERQEGALPVLPIYTYNGKKYIQSDWLHAYIRTVPGRMDPNFTYKEISDDNLNANLAIMKEEYHKDIPVEYLEMDEEQATLIRDAEDEKTK